MELLEEKDCAEIAQRIHELSKDMDYLDYEEEKEKELQELTDCIYYIKACAQNKYNFDYFRTFYNALQRL